MSIMQSLAVGVGVIGAICLLLFTFWFTSEAWMSSPYADPKPSRSQVILLRVVSVLLWVLIASVIAYFGSQPLPPA